MVDIFTLRTGNVLTEIRKVADKSVRCVVTSPPYFSLRDYQTAKWVGGGVNCDHKATKPDGGERKNRSVPEGRGGVYKDVCGKCGAKRIDEQIGLEETPELYVEKLVAVFRECRRVLTDDGTLWLNLGDSYWGGKGQSSQAWSTENQDRDTLQKAQHQITGKGQTRPTDGKHPVIKPKDLIGIPWMVAFALRADGWYLRAEIIWEKPNPMPESVTDRPTRAHEQIFLLSKSKNYYYDYQAILEPANYDGRKDLVMKGSAKYANGFAPEGTNPQTVAVKGHVRWKNKMQTGRTERKLEGTGTAGDGTGLKGHSGYFDTDGNPRVHQMEDGVFARNKRTVWNVATKPYAEAHFATYPPELIEPCILAGSEKGDIVLDPFSGSGTTGYVAVMHNRRYIGFDLNPEYNKLARKRILSAKPVLFGLERINA